MIVTSPIQDKKMIIDGEVISYYDNLYGEITLLFIHGSFLNKDYWQKQLYYFHDHRVIAIDLAGHGKSSANRENFTINQYGKDIADFINELSLQNVILIGHS